MMDGELTIMEGRFPSEIVYFRLYLTSTAVHFSERNVSIFLRMFCCMFTRRRYEIPLTDIEDIAVGCLAGVKHRQGCCSFNEGLHSTLYIQLKPGKAVKRCWRYCNVPTVVKINGCINPREFVDAVKKQMLLVAQE